MSEAAKPDNNQAEGDAAPSRADQLRQQLKVVAHYLSIGFAPLAAAAALALAIVALVANQSVQSHSYDVTAKLGQLSASLLATKSEMEKLRAELNQEKALREEAQKQLQQQQELSGKLVQATSHVQTKLKIMPTLEEQLRQPATPPAPAAASAQPAPIPAPSAAAAAPAPTPPAAGDKKAGTSIHGLKEALDKLNKK